MIQTIRKAISISLLVLACLQTAQVHAKDNAYHFCGAKSDENKAYYATGLIPGTIRIASSSELRNHLIEKYNHASIDVKCFSYGNDAKPATIEIAEKLRDLEIKKAGLSYEIIPIDWLPY